MTTPADAAIGATPGADPTATSSVAATPEADGDGAAGTAVPVEAAQRGGRLEFLDAIRGLAAVAVLLGHLLEPLSRRYTIWEHTTFRPGEFGVVLFFLTSGFIIPASLERHSSVGRFWTGRVLRLYPLYLSCIAGAFVLHHTGHFGLAPDWDGARSWLLNATMVQNFVAGPQALGNAWTLAYEMVFYLAMTLLFLGRRHQQSVTLAVGLLLAAVAVGTFIPNRLLVPFTLRHWIIVGALAAGLALAMLAKVRPTLRSRVLAVLLSGVVVAGVANRPEDLYLSLMFFGTMFVGTVVYRALHGQVPVRTAVAVYVAALALMAVAFWTNLTPYADPSTGAQINWHAETLTFWAAYGVFGLGLALRHRHFPRVVTYVGKISYSLYLVHPLVLYSVPWASTKELTYLRWIVGSTLLAIATYHLIEQPFQKWGRTLSRRVAVHADDLADPT